MNTPLYLLRHTHVAIENGLCYGQLDVDVAKSFSDEVTHIQKLLRPLSLSHVYTSPLQRCTKLAAALHLTACKDKRLMEMDFGHWEGQSWESIYTSETGKKWFENPLTLPCPEGESFSDVIARTSSFIHDLKEVSNMQEVSGATLLIAHGGSIRAILATLCQIPHHELFDIAIPYGHIIVIRQGQFTALC